MIIFSDRKVGRRVRQVIEYWDNSNMLNIILNLFTKLHTYTYKEEGVSCLPKRIKFSLSLLSASRDFSHFSFLLAYYFTSHFYCFYSFYPKIFYNILWYFLPYQSLSRKKNVLFHIFQISCMKLLKKISSFSQTKSFTNECWENKSQFYTKPELMFEDTLPKIK